MKQGLFWSISLICWSSSPTNHVVVSLCSILACFSGQAALGWHIVIMWFPEVLSLTLGREGGICVLPHRGPPPAKHHREALTRLQSFSMVLIYLTNNHNYSLSLWSLSESIRSHHKRSNYGEVFMVTVNGLQQKHSTGATQVGLLVGPDKITSFFTWFRNFSPNSVLFFQVWVLPCFFCCSISKSLFFSFEFGPYYYSP